MDDVWRKLSSGGNPAPLVTFTDKSRRVASEQDGLRVGDARARSSDRMAGVVDDRYSQVEVAHDRPPWFATCTRPDSAAWCAML